MNTTGGRVTLSINGQTISARAKADIEPSGVEIAAGANLDGTGYRTIKPVLSTINLSFDRGQGFKWDTTMMTQSVSCTFIEDDVGVTHLFTAGSFTGRPSINTETGEVSGVKIESDQYQQLQS